MRKGRFYTVEFCKGVVFSKRNFVKGPFFWHGILWRGSFYDMEFCEEAAKHPKISPGSTPAYLYLRTFKTKHKKILNNKEFPHTVGSKIILALWIILAIFLWFDCQISSSHACYKQHKT